VAKSRQTTEVEILTQSENASSGGELTMSENLVGMKVMVPVTVVRHVPVSPTRHRVRVLVGDSLAEIDLDLPVAVVSEWAANGTRGELDTVPELSGMLGIPMHTG